MAGEECSQDFRIYLEWEVGRINHLNILQRASHYLLQLQ